MTSYRLHSILIENAAGVQGTGKADGREGRRDVKYVHAILCDGAWKDTRPHRKNALIEIGLNSVIL